MFVQTSGKAALDAELALLLASEDPTIDERDCTDPADEAADDAADRDATDCDALLPPPDELDAATVSHSMTVETLAAHWHRGTPSTQRNLSGGQEEVGTVPAGQTTAFTPQNPAQRGVDRRESKQTGTPVLQLHEALLLQ